MTGPGEVPPADMCPSDGKKPEDECDTNVTAADTCDPKVEKSDQCESLPPPDDQCPDKKTEDDCSTGQFPEDECDPKGTDAQGDQCPGGDPINGLDTCDPEGGGVNAGDDCSSGSFGDKDDCKASHPDECTNTASESGYDDKCVGARGSDQCTDGTDATDVCTGKKWGLYDTCPGGGKDVDKCEPNGASKSDDYCFAGKPDNDECSASGDEDECPEGQASVDECPTGEPPEDECTAQGGCSGGDQVGTNPLVDSCTPTSTPSDSCVNPYPDFPNPE